LPYASELVEFSPGPNAGFGRDDLPSVVLGPPASVGGGGSLDVLSLGIGGEIILGFGDRPIGDGDGDDFVVFENAFRIADGGGVFFELGEVSVSVDGEHWVTFACDPDPAGDAFPGCAGWTPTEPFDPETLVPLDPAVSGGDAFDLADVGLERAEFVRVRDLSTEGAGTSAGFDLDAIGVVHFETSR